MEYVWEMSKRMSRKITYNSGLQSKWITSCNPLGLQSVARRSMARQQKVVMRRIAEDGQIKVVTIAKQKNREF